MQLNQSNLITRRDLECHQALLSVINQGDFKIKGEAIQKVAWLHSWYMGLGDKLQKIVNLSEAAKAEPDLPRLKKKIGKKK